MGYLDENNIVDIFTDENGDLAFLGANTLEVYGSSVAAIEGYLETPNSNLNEPEVDKVLEYIILDYIGSATIEIYLDNVLSHTLSYPYTSTRQSYKLYILPQYRQAAEKLYFKIKTSQSGTIIYNMYINFIILPRRRGIA